VPARRQVHGQHLPGPLPGEEHRRGRLRRDQPREGLPRQRLRALRDGGERLGVGLRLVPAGLLRPPGLAGWNRAQPTRTVRQLRSVGARRAEAGPEGRLVPLHRPVLLPLHARWTRQGRAGHRDEPPRVPAGQELTQPALSLSTRSYFITFSSRGAYWSANTRFQSFFMSTTVHFLATASSHALSSFPTCEVRS